MKSKNVTLATILLMVTAFWSVVSAQDLVEIKSEKVLVLNLYRGIVDVIPHSSNQLEMIHEMYDYDIYTERNELVIFEETYQNKKELEVFSTSDTLHLRNENSRELQYIKLKVPEGMELVINIIHNGKITIRKAMNSIQAEIFNGEIKIEEAYSSVSAVVVREGDIEVFSYSDSEKNSIALSTYNGNITLNSSSKNLNAILKSDLGEIKNELGMSFEITRNIEFEQVEDGEREIIKAFWYKGKLGNGKGPSILITNTRGDIILRQI